MKEYLSELEVVAGVLVAGGKIGLIDDDGRDPKLEEGAAQCQQEEGVAGLPPDADVAERVEDGGVAEDGEQQPAPDGEAGGGVDGVEVGLREGSYRGIRS